MLTRYATSQRLAVARDKQAQELDEEESSMIFKMIDSFLTKKKFKDFFNKNVASL
ncbi:hypothetical protein [Maribacter sp. 2-571]|uniref:hypothetical protein n=1 Tax=Maribacter sp. 2-571 TaxID=3417569 RepID=UPI003D32EAF5